MKLQKKYDKILEKIVEYSYLTKTPKDNKEIEEVFLSLFRKIIKINQKESFISKILKLDDFIYLTSYEYNLLKFHILKNRIGYGKLEPLLKDIYIEDISCNGVGEIWLVHKIFGSIKTNLTFKDDVELNQYIFETSEKVERPISDSKPIIDAMMPDGSRVNFIYSRNISLKGSSFTIRKFNELPINIPNLCKWNTISSQIGAYLWLCLENDISVFICGETASGKTTTLNAMTSFIPQTKKVYSVEQTPEVTMKHDFWQHLITRESGQNSDVTMFDLLIASLRSRPDYIIVGEIRGKEANVTFQAMQTGHPVISTFHARDLKSMVQRLTGDPINIPIAFMDNLNLVLFQAPVYVDGKVERRVLNVTEIIRYEDTIGKMLSKQVFRWNNVKDKHEFRGLYNSNILEEKIAKLLGLKNKREIYQILDERKRILDKMIELEIFDDERIIKAFDSYRKSGLAGLDFEI